MNYICKKCRIHTMQAMNPLGNGRYTITCLECNERSPVFDIDGKEVPKEKLIEEEQNWR
jgi:hypothetical protein